MADLDRLDRSVNAGLPPSVEALFRVLSWRMWRESAATCASIGVWGAALILAASGLLNLTLRAQDVATAGALALAALGVALAMGAAQRRPDLACAAREADRRLGTPALFASAWEVAALPPDRRPGAAPLVLAQAARLAVSRGVELRRRRRQAGWRAALPYGIAAIALLPLLMPGAYAPRATAGRSAAMPATPADALDDVLAAVDRAVVRGEPFLSRPDRSEGTALRSAPAAAGRGAPAIAARPSDARPAQAAPRPPMPESALAARGGTGAGNAPGTRRLAPQEQAAAPAGATHRVPLTRHNGGAGEGGVALAPVAMLPTISAGANADSRRAADPWPMALPPALRHYVTAVRARMSRPQ